MAKTSRIKRFRGRARKKAETKSEVRRGTSLTKKQTMKPPSKDAVVSRITHDDSKRYLARLMYISGLGTIASIAQELGIPFGTARSWHTLDNWARLKREVVRYASKEAVQKARRSMGRYLTSIDDELSTILASMNTKLNEQDEDKKLTAISSENLAYKVLLQTLRLKMSLAQVVMQGARGKALAPHPTTSVFPGMEDPQGALASSRLETLLQSIPEYMTEAARIVLAMDPEKDLPPEVLDAVSIVTEEADTSDDDMFFDDEEDMG